MNCDEVRALLVECHEGAIEESRRRETEAHLAGCAACRAAREEVRNLDRFLRQRVRIPEPPREFWTLQERRALERSAGARRRRLPLSAWVLVGAGAAAAVLLAFGLSYRSEDLPEKRSIGETAGAAAPVAPAEEPAVLPPVPRTSVPEPKPAESPNRIAEHRREFYFPRIPDTGDAPDPAGGGDGTVPLPGEPDHLDRLTDEAIEVGLAETPLERIAGLLKAATARLAELRDAMKVGNRAAAEELTEAYLVIFREGIAALLADRTSEERDLAAARVLARDGARSNAETLARMEPEADGTLKSALRGALQATREMGGQ